MANDTAKRLLARIRALREARGLTQEAFAERAGLTYKHYQQVEAGRKFDIRLSSLIKMADGLGLKLSELVDFDLAAPAVRETAGAYRTPGKTTKKASGPSASQTRRLPGSGTRP